MSKFDITQWCDYVRGLVEPEISEAMRQDYEQATAKERRAVDALRRLEEVGRHDLGLQIPAHALRGAKAIGSLQRTGEHAGTPSKRLRFLPFEISFDSFLQPAMSGTRKLHSMDRQLVFEAETYRVDLRLEQETDQPNTVIVGELLQQEEKEDRPLPRVPVWIKSGERIVGRAMTGEFGEFQAEGLPASSLTLCLLVDDDVCVELPIREGTEG